MGSPMGAERDWARLGELLTRRRVELDSRYQSLRLFAAERDINYRLAWDIEGAKRTTFTVPRLANIARAYGVTYESIEAALQGGHLEAVDGAAATSAAAHDPAPAPRGDRDLEDFNHTITAIWAQVQAARARNPQASPADIFPTEPPLAEIWSYDVLSEPERVRHMATFRYLQSRGVLNVSPVPQDLRGFPVENGRDKP